MLADRCSSLSSSSVLVVDDEGIIVDVIREVLGPRVEKFDSAANGEEALRKLLWFDYDHILLDIKMPVMNGMELYKNIKRCLPHLSDRVIFITGDAESVEIGSFLKLAGNRYLTKPFKGSELLEIMMCRVT